ncbi:Bacterial leucyl aminopeptidase precursor [Tsuneonella dongtanensis]|uniref:Bacterial leucyl aminopeptidase n=1 Tax=Tsuneonella dongtanensis TaxID=692370 RepID=A0A1B2AE94_9SPHN|nr:M28 family peptidase [Tsuneonella dongtanensis]ANY20463.1 Bacterial leucyl aminopeptidase precursor [Tsuneonella dongtanensis]
MRVAWLLVVVLLAGCVSARPGAVPATDAALRAALTRHVSILASDEFGGRMPGTEGETKTLRYLLQEWRGAGLVSGTNDPANPWFAPVELTSSKPERSTVRFLRNGRSIALPADGAVVFASGRRGLVERAPVLFVGEQGEKLDNAALAGRVVLMLWDHPGQAEQREALLRGGAAAVLAIVGEASDFDELVETRRRGSYRLAATDGSDTLDGYLSRETAEALIGADRFQTLLRDARGPDFKPVAIDLTATLDAASTAGTVKTFNVVGRLPGRRPEAGAVLLMAHWDHFGRCGSPTDPAAICNGAVDNASGLAVITELARRLANGPRLQRDVYFLATTAEEWGLLGAQAFAENPPVPLETIVAAFNLDTIAVAPKGTPVAIVGKGMTGLDAGIMEVLQQLGRREADENLAQGYLRRQDGWALLQRDVPTVSVTSAFGSAAALERYNAERYHRPADKADGIELGGAIEDLFLTQALVRYFADPARWTATTGKSVEAP